MKNQSALLALRFLVVGVLISGLGVSGVGLAATVQADTRLSEYAPALKILSQKGVLCYAADVIVDEQSDKVLNRQVEKTIINTLGKLSLKAVKYNANSRRTCDRLLSYTFDFHNLGEVTIFTSNLSLKSLHTTVNNVKLDEVLVYVLEETYGYGKNMKMNPYAKTMQNFLASALQNFTYDYRQVVR